MEKIRKNLFQKIIFFISIFFLTACTSYRQSIQVSSYSSYENAGKKYFIQPAEKKLKDKNLVFEIKGFLVR